MFSMIGAGLLTVIVFLAVIAALSRLLKMKQLPNYIDAGTGALTNLFKGAFATNA